MNSLLNSNIFAYFYHHSLEAQSLVRRQKSKLITFYFVVAIFCGSASILFNLSIGYMTCAFYQAIVVMLAGAVLVRNKMLGPSEWSGNLLSAFVLSFALIYQIHAFGIYSASVTWFIVVPVPAILYQSKKTGAFWSLICAVMFVTMWKIEPFRPELFSFSPNEALFIETLSLLMGLTFVGSVLMAHDQIHVQAFQSIESQGRRNVQILNNIQDGVVLISDDGDILVTNPAAQSMLQHHNNRQSIQNIFPQWSAQQGPISGASNTIDGKSLELFQTELLFEEQHEFLLVIHDATEHQRMIEELQQARDVAISASKTKSRFLAMMSHELRTPLNAIIGYTELLKEEFEDFNARLEWLEDLHRISGSGHHLLSVVGNILDLSKIEAGHVTCSPSRVSLQTIIDNVLASTEGLAVNTEVTFIKEIEIDPSFELFIDEAKLCQIMINLVGNAFKFTPKGSVTLSIQHTTSQLRFSVIDTGLGIPEKEQLTIFNPFQQVDNSSTRQHDGSGLGLTISMQLAKMLDANLSLESTLGEGTAFHLDLPIKTKLRLVS